MTHHFRFIPVKCNGKNFQKLQKTTFWQTFLVSFEPKSYIHAKNQKKTSEVFLKKKRTDRRAETANLRCPWCFAWVQQILL